MKTILISLALAFASVSLVAETSAVTQTKKSTAKKSSSKKTYTKKSTKRSTMKKSSTKTPVAKVDPAAVPVAGTWYTVDTTGKFVKMNKFVLDKYGKFKYVGPGWTSEGTFKLAKVEENVELRLVWTKIDGAAVKANTVKKTIPMTPDKKFFQLDRFKYGKAS